MIVYGMKHDSLWDDRGWAKYAMRTLILSGFRKTKTPHFRLKHDKFWDII